MSRFAVSGRPIHMRISMMLVAFSLVAASGCEDEFQALDDDAGPSDAAPSDARVEVTPSIVLMAAVGGDSVFRVTDGVSAVATGGPDGWFWTASRETSLDGIAYWVSAGGSSLWSPISDRFCGLDERMYAFNGGFTSPPEDDDTLDSPVELTVVSDGAPPEQKRLALEGDVFVARCVVGPQHNVHFVGTATRGTDLGGGPLGEELPGTERRVAFVASFDGELRHRHSRAIGVDPTANGVYVAPIPGGEVALHGRRLADELWGETLPATDGFLAAVDVAAGEVAGAWGIEGLSPWEPVPAYGVDSVLITFLFQSDTASIGAQSLSPSAPLEALHDAYAYFLFDGTEPTEIGAATLYPAPVAGASIPPLRGYGSTVRETDPPWRGPAETIVDARLGIGTGIEWLLGTDAEHAEGALFPVEDDSAVASVTFDGSTLVTTLLADGERTIGTTTFGVEGERRIYRIEHSFDGEVSGTPVDLGPADALIGSTSAQILPDGYLVQRADGALAIVRAGGTTTHDIPVTATASTDCSIGGERTRMEIGGHGAALWVVDFDCPGASEVELSVGDESLTIPRPRGSVIVSVSLRDA
jgi:hypothetical protein